MKPFAGSFTQQEPLDDSAIAAATEVLRSGRLHRYNTIPGERSKAAELEQAYAAYQGARYCLACASGGYAMAIALRAAGLVPGEAVRFRWWPSDSPAEESSVELVVAPWGDGSRLTVRESRPGLAAAWFSASALVAPVPGPSALVTSVSITSTVGITVTGSCLRAAGVQFTLAA